MSDEPSAEDEAPESADGQDDDPEELDIRDEYQRAFGEAKPLAYTGGEWTSNERELPAPIADGDLADAWVPPFLPETQVCIADTQKFVIRDAWRDIVAEFEPKEVERAPNGNYRVPLALAQERVGSHGEARSRRAVDACMRMGTKGDFCNVEPIRPECVHYVRQLDPPSPTDELQGYRFGDLRRYCAARAGSWFALKDTAIRACSMRNPPSAESNDWLKRFDEGLIEKARNRQYTPLFNIRKKEAPPLEAFQEASAAILKAPS